MNNKIIKKLSAGMLSVLVFGSQLPSGSALRNNLFLDNVQTQVKKAEKSKIELKGVFEVDGLKEALEKIESTDDKFWKYRKDSTRLEIDPASNSVKIKVMDKSFDLSYGKLANKETGEIEEIKIPYGIRRIEAGVFENILKNANAQGKKIRRIILPETLIYISDGLFENILVDSVVVSPNNLHELNTEVFKNNFSLKAVFVPKRVEKQVKENLGNRIKVFQNFELKSAFDIKGLKEAIVDALANGQKVDFKQEGGINLGPVLCVGDKEFYPDYSKLKDEKTGKIENLELPYGIRYIGSPIIHTMCCSCSKILNDSQVNNIVIPDTVENMEKGALCFIKARHIVLSENLKSLSLNAFGYCVSENVFGECLINNMCEVREITISSKLQNSVKCAFGNAGVKINII